MKDITKKYSIEFALDLPIFIDGLELHPIKLKNLASYYSSVSIIKLSKAQINPLYIKMSYYTFLCHYIVTLSKSPIEEEQKKGETALILLGSLFSLSMKKNVIPKVLYNQETKESSIQLYEIDIENVDKVKSLYENPKQVFTLTKENFDEIREILIYQNDVHYIDYNKYSKDVQELLLQEEQRRQNKSTTTLEDKVDSVVAATGWDTETVSNLSIRRFERIFDRVVKKLEYQINKTGAMSGLISFKDKSILEPWTGSIDNDPLKHIFADYNSTINNTKGMMGKI